MAATKPIIPTLAYHHKTKTLLPINLKPFKTPPTLKSLSFALKCTYDDIASSIGQPDILSGMFQESFSTKDVESLSPEENKAIHDQLMTTLKNMDEDVVYEEFKELMSGFESFSPKKNRALFDQAIRTFENDDGSVSVGFKDFMSGMVEDCLETEDVESLMSGIIGEKLSKEESEDLFDQLMRRLDVKKECVTNKVGKSDVKIRKMKAFIIQLVVIDAQLEKCQKELSEVRALVEEAKRSLEIEVEDEDSIKRFESLKAAAISVLIDILVKVSAKAVVEEAKRSLKIGFKDNDSVTKTEGMSKNKKRFESLKAAAISALIETLVKVFLR